MRYIQLEKPTPGSKHYEDFQKWESAKSDVNNPIARQMTKEKAKAIREMVKQDKELSSIAQACVISTGDSRIIGLLS